MAQEAFSELTFDELELDERLKKAVNSLGFKFMTPIQAQAIPQLLTGRDIIGQAQTGTGKTAAFGLPILQMIDPTNKNIQAIILCPTRELAVQATNEIRNFAKYMESIKVLAVYGGQDIQVQIRGLKGVQIIVGTPGRVMDHMRRHTIKMDDVRMVVLDEADEMLDMGFREDMEVILGAIEHEHQTCLFSATMPKEILDMTDRFQNDPEMVKVNQKALTLEKIKQYYYPIKYEYKDIALVRLLKYHNCKKCMVFCNTKDKVDDLSVMLQKEGYSADGLHGDLSQKARDSVMGRFRTGSVNVLVATDIAARGIDVGDVEAVYNYDVPQELEYYVHRIGRTGRAGKDGSSHTLCRNKDFSKIREIEKLCHCKMEEKKIPSAEEIREANEQAALNRILSIINEGHSGRLVPAITKFCEENNITPESFAAACLRDEAGAFDEKDDIDINLPDKPDKPKRNHSRSRNFGFDKDLFTEGRRWSGGKFGDRSESRHEFGSRSGRKSESGFGNNRKKSGFGDEEHQDRKDRFGSHDNEKRFGSRDHKDRKHGDFKSETFKKEKRKSTYQDLRMDGSKKSKRRNG